MKRTLSVCAGFAALATLAVAAGVSPAFADAAAAGASSAESLLDYSATATAPTLVAGGLSFAATGQIIGIDHTESAVPLAQLGGLTYDVAVAPAAGGMDPAYTLDLDSTGSGNVDARLTAEPDQNGLAATASGSFDATGWNFWSSAIDASADGGQSSPEPLSWFASTYPAAVVMGHGLELSATATTGSAIVSATGFDGAETDFTLGTQASPIATDSVPAGATEVTAGSVGGIDAQSGFGSETDLMSADSAFGPVYYNVTTSHVKDPAAVIGLSGPTVTQPQGSTVAQGGKFVWQESAKGAVALAPSDEGSWAVDGAAATAGPAISLADGAHTVTFTPASGKLVYPDDVPKGGVLNSDGTVSFAVTLTPGVANGAAKVTTSKVPTITGTAQVGHALTANIGTVSPSGAHVAYQWLLNGTAIRGATGATFTPASSGYVTKKLSVTVTASLAGYTSYTARSAQTSAVTAGTLVSAVPGITGTTKVGDRLTAKPGTWTAGTTLTYQWYANGRAIAGEHYATLALRAAQVGTKIGLRVTGSKSGYTTLARTSHATASISPATLVGTAPTISVSSSYSGDPLVGATLNAHLHSWTAGATFHYQWYANGTPIGGANKSSFKVPASLIGHTFHVAVKGTKAGYTTLTKSSSSTAAAIQTKAYYTAHDANKTTYGIVISGLEGNAGAGEYGDPGEVQVLWEPYGDANVYEADGAGATGYYKELTLTNAPSSWLLMDVSVDPGFDSDFNDAYATVSIFEKPAGAPDVYYSLHKQSSGASIVEVDLYGGQ